MSIINYMLVLAISVLSSLQMIFLDKDSNENVIIGLKPLSIFMFFLNSVAYYRGFDEMSFMVVMLY